MAAHGWLYAAPGTAGDASGYDTPRALYPADLLAWVQTTQPQAWEALTKNHGAAAESMLLDRLRKTLDERGTLEVLRVGMDMLGLKSPLKLAQFKPALAMNPDLQARYAANRLRVVRQCRTNHEDIIDLVLFLNGIPVATAELKTDFTQDINAAVDQYRFDRIPKPKGKPFAEPLLDFPRGALVHFAVSNRTVMMTTRLQGPSTRFLPFNLGDHGGAGNPANPNGHRTAYLWEQVWQRDSWLEILGRYLVTQRDSKKNVSGFIFPRYHQLDATRKLVAAVLQEGAGHKYLIQHSAGSGKTNSIAWTAHFLADLHDADNHKLFDSVRLHPYNISQKVAVVVEHFRENVQPLLDGHAKAMVVVGSRQEAVRWQLAIQTYIKEQGYKLGALVAFSGEVNDPESLPEPVTENSTQLNPLLKGRDMREAFATDEYQILLVANKFQTGFDQPLLCGMYVDKRLGGIQAVQTLSRLNRAYSGPYGLKDTTYILDFVNEPDDVLAAFKTYYETAELSGVTDPHLVYDLRAKLDAAGHYDDFEVERVVQAEMNPKATQAMLVAAIEPVADRLLKRYKSAQQALQEAQSGPMVDGPTIQAAKHDLAALRRKKTDEMSTEELQALAADLGPRHVRAKRLQQAIAEREAYPSIHDRLNL